jgi:hypothetical protein
MIGGILMAHAVAASASQEAESSAGYILLPRQLRQDCRHVGINTLKLVLYIADATLGWDFSRWAALTYQTIVAEAGIPNDACVRRALEEARASSLIEIKTTAAGTLYAIHRRYWVFARVQPRWHLYKRVPYDAQTDPLDERQPAITMIAQPLETNAPVHNDTISMIASDYHHDSDLLSPGKQATITMIAQPLPEAAPVLTSRTAKEIKKEEGKEQRKEEAATESEPPVAQDADALAQRLADQHLLQQLLAEQEHLRQIKPSQTGWGEAQRRLRALTREITRLQALFTLQATAPGRADPAAASNQAESLEERGSPPIEQPRRRIRDQGAPTDAASVQDTRRQRLMKLQSEVAQLKRTPSMQLLARQRLPLLEAEIKQLIGEIAESA